MDSWLRSMETSGPVGRQGQMARPVRIMKRCWHDVKWRHSSPPAPDERSPTSSSPWFGSALATMAAAGYAVPASPSWCSRRFRRPRCAWPASGSVEHAEDRPSAPDSIPPSAAEPSREARVDSGRHDTVLFRQAAVLSRAAPRADPAASAGVVGEHDARARRPCRCCTDGSNRSSSSFVLPRVLGG